MLPPDERAARGRALSDELAVALDERRLHALEATDAGLQIPEPHLFEIKIGRLLSLSVTPGDEREERPPRVTDERNASRAHARHGAHRFLQPRAAPRQRSFGRGLAHEDRALVAVP